MAYSVEKSTQSQQQQRKCKKKRLEKLSILFSASFHREISVVYWQNIKHIVPYVHLNWYGWVSGMYGKKKQQKNH